MPQPQYRLTRRGEIVRDAAVVAFGIGCLMAIGFFAFGLMVGWFG